MTLCRVRHAGGPLRWQYRTTAAVAATVIPSIGLRCTLQTVQPTLFNQLRHLHRLSIVSTCTALTVQHRQLHRQRRKALGQSKKGTAADPGLGLAAHTPADTALADTVDAVSSTASTRPPTLDRDNNGQPPRTKDDPDAEETQQPSKQSQAAYNATDLAYLSMIASGDAVTDETAKIHEALSRLEKSVSFVRGDIGILFDEHTVSVNRMTNAVDAPGLIARLNAIERSLERIPDDMYAAKLELSKDVRKNMQTVAASMITSVESSISKLAESLSLQHKQQQIAAAQDRAVLSELALSVSSLVESVNEIRSMQQSPLQHAEIPAKRTGLLTSAFEAFERMGHGSQALQPDQAVHSALEAEAGIQATLPRRKSPAETQQDSVIPELILALQSASVDLINVDGIDVAMIDSVEGTDVFFKVLADFIRHITVVGLDAETAFRNGANFGAPSTIQIALSANFVAIFQVYRMCCQTPPRAKGGDVSADGFDAARFPRSLANFLSNGNIYKTGVGIIDDTRRIILHFKSPVSSIVRIESLARSLQIESSLAALSTSYCGIKLPKAGRFPATHWWDAPMADMPMSSIKYAAMDAVASLTVYRAMISMPPAGSPELTAAYQPDVEVDDTIFDTKKSEIVDMRQSFEPAATTASAKEPTLDATAAIEADTPIDGNAATPQPTTGNGMKSSVPPRLETTRSLLGEHVAATTPPLLASATPTTATAATAAEDLEGSQPVPEVATTSSSVALSTPKGPFPNVYRQVFRQAAANRKRIDMAQLEDMVASYLPWAPTTNNQNFIRDIIASWINIGWVANADDGIVFLKRSHSRIASGSTIRPAETTAASAIIASEPSAVVSTEPPLSASTSNLTPPANAPLQVPASKPAATIVIPEVPAADAAAPDAAGDDTSQPKTAVAPLSVDKQDTAPSGMPAKPQRSANPRTMFSSLVRKWLSPASKHAASRSPISDRQQQQLFRHLYVTFSQYSIVDLNLLQSYIVTLPLVKSLDLPQEKCDELVSGLLTDWQTNGHIKLSGSACNTRIVFARAALPAASPAALDADVDNSEADRGWFWHSTVLAPNVSTVEARPLLRQLQQKHTVHFGLSEILASVAQSLRERDVVASMSKSAIAHPSSYAKLTGTAIPADLQQAATLASIRLVNNWIQTGQVKGQALDYSLLLRQTLDLSLSTVLQWLKQTLTGMPKTPTRSLVMHSYYFYANPHSRLHSLQTINAEPLRSSEKLHSRICFDMETQLRPRISSKQLAIVAFTKESLTKFLDGCLSIAPSDRTAAIDRIVRAWIKEGWLAKVSDNRGPLYMFHPQKVVDWQQGQKAGAAAKK
ncbi:hypothetical protein BC831DRAFT_507931 [Entophlyctis helioformis]|nr:hypothetical protein BC831DRAFT_507931 [Entophlyctis helioformis]